jgi:cell division protein FtsB
MKNLFRSRTQILAVVIFVVFVFLMMDLNNRMGELFRLSSQRDKMQIEVVQLRRTEQALVTQVAYATSDAAVKKWAYEEGHKMMPGDNVIIPLSPDNYTPPTPTPIAVTQQKVENWEVWKALFLGNK